MSDIAVTIGANIIDFVSDMNKAGESVTGFDKKTRALINTMGKYAAASVAAGTAVIAGLYVSASETIDQQAKLARSLGSTTAGFQSLNYVADLSGISQEELAKSSAKLNQKLGEAIQVGGLASKEFDRLGLSAKELSKMDAGERLATIADRLIALKYNSTEAAFALKEMGLKGNEMLAMMMDGGQQFRDANKELRELNVLVSDTDSSKIEAANDSWTKAKLVITGVANTLAVQLSPYVQVVAENLRNASIESGGFKDQISAAIKSGLTGLAEFADVLQGLRVVFKGIELVAVSFGAAVISVFEGLATLITKFFDGFVLGANLAIAAQNSLTGSAKEFLTLPSESNFMKGLHDAGDSARNEISVLKSELQTLALQKMPSAAVAKYLADVEKKATEAAQAVVDSRKHMVEMPEENEEQKAKKQKADNILDGLRAGTESMQSELDKRKEVLDIYRKNTLASDASYYDQQLNDISVNEKLKDAEILEADKKDAARRAQQKAKNLNSVLDDKAATAAINAEYDKQDVLAEQIKQEALTQAQEDAQRARQKLDDIARKNSISTALGLGQQLMTLTQGHSKKAFEFAKKASIASAVIDGYQSAVAAWKDGMSSGGPYVAAAFTAASLLKTGALINSIKSTSFNSGGGAANAGGSGDSGASASAYAAPQPGPNAGSTMHVQGLDPSHLFTGAAMQTIAQGLLDYQKDGGRVVFNA